MRASQMLVLLAASALVGTMAESPVEKVITLLEELKTEVEDEGKNEAKTYDTFSCFCKDTTKDKSAAIKTEQDNIEEFASDMQENTESAQEETVKIAKLNDMIAEITKQIETITAMREAQSAQYEGASIDLAKGISALEGAIKNAKAGAGFTEMKSSIKRSLIMADGMDIPAVHRRKMQAFLQAAEGVEPIPDDVKAPEDGKEYDFHAQDMIDTFGALLKTFSAKKDAVEETEAKDKTDYQDLLKTKSDEKTTAIDEKTAAEEAKEKFLTQLGEAQDSLVQEEATLKDDQSYLKDLTANCELKAREWDQQSAMRANEVAALTKALDIINAKVKDNDAAVNRAAMLQTGFKPAPGVAAVPQRVSAVDADIGDVDLAFLQVSNPRSQLSLLAKKATATVEDQLAKRDRVLRALVEKGQKLGSTPIAMLAVAAAGDPFTKVKQMIQDLITRLIAEAAEEANKKGWCDTEIGKANSDRNANMEKIMKINADLGSYEANKDRLMEEIALLTSEITELNELFAKTTKERNAEKAVNMETLEKANEGLAAVKDARDVLAAFYKGAAKGKVSLLEEKAGQDPPDSGMSGAYKGNQGKASGILDMLNVIIGDFKHTISETKKAEKDASREYVKFTKATDTSIATKETQKSNDIFEDKDMDAKITEGLDMLDKTQKTLDDNLATLEDLKPACANTGMSYEDRVQKRKDEIEALKKAICELDTEDPGCIKEEEEEKEEK